MIIERKIGNLSVDVDINEANEIYLQKDCAKLIREPGISGIMNAIYAFHNTAHMPLSLFLEMTSYCNFACPFCYIHENPDTNRRLPDFANLKPTLDYLIENGLIYCLMSGGECLSHPDFKDIYLYLKKAGVLVTVFTNGYLLNDALFELFEEYKPFKIEISVYGHDDASYRNTTLCSQVDSGRVFNNVLRLKEMGLNVVCKTPITSLTETSYPLIEKWCAEHKIPYYTGTELMDTYSGESRKQYLASEKLRKEFREKSDAAFFADEGMMKLAHSERAQKKSFDCTAGRTEIFINSGYKLLPCMKAASVEEWKIDIAENGIQEAYRLLNGKIDAVLGKAIQYCAGCTHHEVCQECFMTQYEHTNLKKHRQEYCQSLKEFMKQ